eukprot:2114592-Rhodomonas_salina.1
MDKLNKLEQKDGFEFLRTFIRLFKSGKPPIPHILIFLLVFVAHFAGCIFVMLTKGSPEWNWLKAYDEEILYEGNFMQYTVPSLPTRNPVHVLGPGSVAVSEGGTRSLCFSSGATGIV